MGKFKRGRNRKRRHNQTPSQTKSLPQQSSQPLETTSTNESSSETPFLTKAKLFIGHTITVVLVLAIIVLAIYGIIYLYHTYTSARTIIENSYKIDASNAFIDSQFYESPDVLRWTDDQGEVHHLYCSYIEYSGPYPTDYGENGYYPYHYMYIHNSDVKKSVTIRLQSYNQGGEQLTYYQYSSEADEAITVASIQLVKVNDMVYEKECQYTEIQEQIDYDDPAAVQAYLCLYPVAIKINSITVPLTYDTNHVTSLSNDDPSVYHTPAPSTPPCDCTDCCCKECTCKS